MKLLIKIFFLLVLSVFAKAQNMQSLFDSLNLVVRHAKTDTSRMDAYRLLCSNYDDINLDSALYYGEKGRLIAGRLKLKLDEAEILMDISFPLGKMGNYPEALKVLTQALDITEDPANEQYTWHLKQNQTAQLYRIHVLGYTHLGLENLYGFTSNFETQITEAFKAIKIGESIKDSLLLAFVYGDIGDAYLNLNKLDSALLYDQESLKYFSAVPYNARKYEAGTYSSIGKIYEQLGNINLARKNYEIALTVSEKQNNPYNTGNAYLQLANIYQSLNKPNSALLFAKNALTAFTLVGKEKEKVLAYTMISDFFGARKNADSSFHYLRLATLLNDSLYKIEKKKLKEFQATQFINQLRLQQLEKEKIKTENKIRIYTMLGGLAIFSIISFILYRNNQKEKKAKKQLQEKNKIIEQTLSNLKSTQNQLIQKEKLASLGELTAGIAHEIQNPLNFVNNFSELSVDLVKDVNEEIDKETIDKDYVKDLMSDLTSNQQKINHHGKRASSIVKGMLEHSRTSTGEREPTDINKLADEYLRLSYHGLRAKDKNFNSDYKTDFDATLPELNVVPQDIGRVLLNLINNAFWAVNEKSKQGLENYMPEVMVSTKKIGDAIEIKVKDNGNGIPDKIKDKIFQPFFTTKPTGEGTGLGLSLAYDIVTKGHGGTLEVESLLGEGSEFKITIPSQ